MQSLESVDVPLENGEEVTHFLVAAGASLAEVPDGCASQYMEQVLRKKLHTLGQEQAFSPKPLSAESRYRERVKHRDAE